MTATITVAANADADATLDLARRFLHAVNSKNADALVETVSEDIVYELHTTPAIKVQGHEGVRMALAALVATWPDYDFTVNAVYADANLFTAEWTMTGTLGQNYPIGTRTAVPDGRKISFDGVDICPVVDGKVAVKSSYVDATAWCEQLTFQD